MTARFWQLDCTELDAVEGTFAEIREELGDPANGLLLTFNMLLLADFDLGTFDGEYTVLLRIMFVLSMIMTPIVLLNLLIALMSDSYERIQDRADTEFQLLRARLIREQEAFMSASDKADPRLFPTWLHLLVPKGEAAGRDAGGGRAARAQEGGAGAGHRGYDWRSHVRRFAGAEMGRRGPGTLVPSCNECNTN